MSEWLWWILSWQKIFQSYAYELFFPDKYALLEPGKVVPGMRIMHGIEERRNSKFDWSGFTGGSHWASLWKATRCLSQQDIYYI